MPDDAQVTVSRGDDTKVIPKELEKQYIDRGWEKASSKTSSSSSPKK